MTTLKLTSNQWKFLSFDNNNNDLRYVSEVKKIVKEQFNGDFTMEEGFGEIIFAEKQYMTWFLMQCM